MPTVHNDTMTIPEIIDRLLDKLRRDFYKDRYREFKRDERSLVRALVTYGHECNKRAWNFEADFVYQELMKLLVQIRTSEADIQYLPIYLEGAVRRHIGQRADELNAKAKAIAPKIGAIINNLKPVEAIREPSAVEVFSQMFRGIKKIQRARGKGKATKERQPELI